MSGRTAFDSLPTLVRFDRDLCALSASPINAIVEHIGRDKYRVHHDIIYHQLLRKDLPIWRDAVQHAMLQVCEFAGSRPDELRALVTGKRWRYYFSRVASLQFRSDKSSWHALTRGDQWPRVDDVVRDDPSANATDLDDLMAIAHGGRDGEMGRFLANLSLLFRELPWHSQRLFCLYFFDSYGWLVEAQKTKPSQRMSYRFLAAKSGIPHQTIRAAVMSVAQFIRDNYAKRFHEPLPRHLLGEL